MNKKVLILYLLLLAGISVVSFNTTHAFFKGSATSTNNVFAAAQVFQTPTPTQVPPTGTPTLTPTPTPPIAQTLVINEVLPHSSCVQGQTEGQYVELWNGTSNTINLKNFQLSDGTNTIAISNGNADLATHAFAILVKDNGLIGNGKCIPDVHGAVTPNLGGQVDMNTGTLEILDSGNTVIDTVKWNGITGLNPTINQSIERTPLGHDSDTGLGFTPSDMVVLTTSTPGTE